MTIILDGTTGITTPAINSSGDLELPGGTANGVLYLNGSKIATSGSALVFDGANLGVGVTPSAWDSNRKALQIGTNGALWGQASGSGFLFLSNNLYYDGSDFRYLNTAASAYYTIASDASFRWQQAASGNAGDPISFTQAMTLDASGNLLVGQTNGGFNSAGLPLVVGSGSGNTGITIFSGSASSGSLHFADTATTGQGSYEGYVNYSHSTNSMQFGTSGTERARITSGGNIGINTSSPTTTLTVNGLLTGGLGAQTTAGVTDWNDITNAVAGMGYTLLLGNATNGPGSGTYFHALNFEYNAKDGSGNMTQIAIPYNGTTFYSRYRFSGVWSSWTTGL